MPKGRPKQYMSPPCPKADCLSEDTVKNGKNSDGTPRYRCKDCGTTFGPYEMEIISTTKLKLGETPGGDPKEVSTRTIERPKPPQKIRAVTSATRLQKAIDTFQLMARTAELQQILSDRCLTEMLRWMDENPHEINPATLTMIARFATSNEAALTSAFERSAKLLQLVVEDNGQ